MAPLRKRRGQSSAQLGSVGGVLLNFDQETFSFQVMVNLLRTPLHSPNWSISSWNRAMNQQKAYQQLFQEPDVLRRRRAASEFLRSRRRL
ncbi:hypothetical protein COOONC_08693 [Cooperia oncophora]